MCGRYVRKSTRREIAAQFAIDDDDQTPWAESYNIAPQSFQPIVRHNPTTGLRELSMFRWGLIPYWAKDPKVGYRTINARAETLATAPAFRDALRRRRCLVPADAFYEWQKLDARTRQPFAFALTTGEPYAFAGLWERWKDPATGHWLPTFSIITTTANQIVAPVHDRMPVILDPADYARWLDIAQPPDDALLQPFPAGRMTAWKVNPEVGNAHNDRPALLEPYFPPPALTEEEINLPGDLFSGL